jgi:uncharacterized protein (UPF0332 family)
MDNDSDLFLRKARESLASAENDFRGGRYNSCANRCYYACFQAAVAALLEEGIRSTSGRWKHSFVHSAFSARLINRMELYPTALRRTLTDLQVLRNRADYSTNSIPKFEAYSGLRQCRAFVAAVQDVLGVPL